MDFWCHFCRQICTKLYNSAQNSPISLAKPTTKRGTLAQNVPQHWIILCLKIRFISLLFCLGAQVQVGFDDAKPHRAGFFRVELGADHAALLGSGAHLAAAIHGIGQAVFLRCGLCFIRVDKIAFLSRLHILQGGTGKSVRPPAGYSGFQLMCGTRWGLPSASTSGMRTTRPGIRPRPLCRPNSSDSSNSICIPRQIPSNRYPGPSFA